jgi:hypothetical protein
MECWRGNRMYLVCFGLVISRRRLVAVSAGAKSYLTVLDGLLRLVSDAAANVLAR